LNLFLPIRLLSKITQYTLTRKELANPTVPLIIPKFEFLTKKQRLKVKNHQKMMGFSVLRAQTIRSRSRKRERIITEEKASHPS